MKTILSKLAPPRKGYVAILDTWERRGGDQIRTVRGAISLLKGPSQVELQREAFPDTCEGCVGIIKTERQDRYGFSETKLVSLMTSPTFREAPGVMCLWCIRRIALKETERVGKMLDMFGCRIHIKVSFPKRGTIDGYLERFGSKSAKQEKAK